MDFRGFYDEIIFDVDKPILRKYTGKQGDTKSRGLYVTVTQRNVVIKNLAGLSMRLFYEKPDKTRGFIDGVVDGDKFRIDYTNQMFAVPGVVKAELRLMGANGEVITDKAFKILVDSSIADGSIVSKDERGILDRAFELAEDIIPRLELLDVELLEDVQNKTLQSQLKVAKIEKELNDYKATMQQINIHQSPTQKAIGHGIVSLPKNAAEGQVSVSIKGLTASNLLGQHGDFANGTDELADGWNKTKSIRTKYDADERAQEFSWMYKDRYIYYNVEIKEGHKYYVRFLLKKTSDAEESLLCIGFGNEPLQGLSDTFYVTDDMYNTAEYTEINNILTPTNDYSFIGLTGHGTKPCNAKIKDMTLIDLTELFGTGKEPTLEQCKQIFNGHISGTKSTVGAIKVKSVGKNLFDFKKNGLNPLDYTVDLGDNYKGMPIQLIPNTTYTVQRFLNDWERDTSFALELWHRQGRIMLLNTIGDASSTFTTDSTGIIYLRHRYGTDKRLKSILSTIDIMLQIGETATPYEPYKESVAYITAKDESGNILELRSLPNGVKDEVRVSGGKAELVKRVSDTMEELAEPIITPINVSGNLISYPSGTVYVENAVADAGIYTDKMTVLHQDLPIKALEKLSKIDFMTGLETELDVSNAVISEDKLSFTHPDLVDGDIVFYTYEYDRESTEGEAEIEYYDSRYVVKDSVTGKFYKWHITVANGVPSIELKEV